MKRNKAERDLIQFLEKFPNQWHSFHDDAVTLRAVAVLALLHGLEVDMNSLQMKWKV
jgi:hypothetical protein